MKRLIALMLVLLLALNTIPSVAEEARTGVDLTYARIVEMTRYMRQLATGDYLDIKMVPEAQQTIARTWAEGIADMPRLVVQLDIEKWSALRENQLTFSQEPDVVQLEAESTLIVQLWQYLAYYTSEEAALTEASYEEMMTVNSHINAQMMYAEEGRKGNAVYIVLYDNAAPIFLLVSGENGAVSIQGMFLPSARLQKCGNYGQISLWLMLNGYPITCREIKPE